MTVLAEPSQQPSLIARVVEIPNRRMVDVLNFDSDQLQQPDVCRMLVRVLRINEAIACGALTLLPLSLLLVLLC